VTSINARPVNYVEERIDGPLTITPFQFLNNRPSNCATPKPTINFMASNSTSITTVERDNNRSNYVSYIFPRFVKDYLLQLNNFHSKGKSTRKICVKEVVDTRRCGMCEVVKNSSPTETGFFVQSWYKHIEWCPSWAIQILPPLEMRKDENVDVVNGTSERIQLQLIEHLINPSVIQSAEHHMGSDEEIIYAPFKGSLSLL
jgi:hypothetical protein